MSDTIERTQNKTEASSLETGLPLHTLSGDPIISPEESRAAPGESHLSYTTLAWVYFMASLALGGFVAMMVIGIRFFTFMTAGH